MFRISRVNISMRELDRLKSVPKRPLPSSVPSTQILDRLWRLRSLENATALIWRSRPSDP